MQPSELVKGRDTSQLWLRSAWCVRVEAWMLENALSDEGYGFAVLQDEKASILAGAYEYIEKLQRQVLELYTELDTEFACSDEEVSSCEGDYFSDEDERPVDSNAALEATYLECRGCSHPMVGLCRAFMLFRFDY